MRIGLWRSQENKHAEWKQLLGNFSSGYRQMSCKSFLKSQVGIISLGIFQVFCEARANVRSPRWVFKKAGLRQWLPIWPTIGLPFGVPLAGLLAYP